MILKKLFFFIMTSCYYVLPSTARYSAESANLSSLTGMKLSSNSGVTDEFIVWLPQGSIKICKNNRFKLQLSSLFFNLSKTHQNN